MAHEVSEVERETVVQAEKPRHDAETGALLGGVGGVVAGAFAGAALGPAGVAIGAVVGGVIGATASGVAVAAVDKIDDDNNLSGIPDDMSFESVADREPLVFDRREQPVENTDATKRKEEDLAEERNAETIAVSRVVIIEQHEVEKPPGSGYLV